MLWLNRGDSSQLSDAPLIVCLTLKKQTLNEIEPGDLQDIRNTQCPGIPVRTQAATATAGTDVLCLFPQVQVPRVVYGLTNEL